MTATKIPDREALIGYGAALAAAACYGTLAVLGRKIVSDIAPPMVATAFSMIFGMLIVGFVFQSQIRRDYAARPSTKGWLFIALAGGAATWGVSFWFMALSVAPAVLVAPVAGTHPLFAVLLALVFLRGIERVTWRTIAGTILVIIGVILITFGTR